MNNVFCKVCNTESDELFSTKVLSKYLVKYYKCRSCGFVQTETPYWLEEAYSSAITAQDIGLVSRNYFYAQICNSIIKLFFRRQAKFLDYGGGYGMFVRSMRDKGFDFYRYDTYCKNMFAEGFDDKGEFNYELITAFEVFEHLADPLSEIENMLKKSRSILFSTELQPKKFLNEHDWWYVLPKTGQHISLYTMSSLKFIANKYKLNLYSNGSTLHLLTEKKINGMLFKLSLNMYTGLIINKLIGSPQSLLITDFEQITNAI